MPDNAIDATSSAPGSSSQSTGTIATPGKSADPGGTPPTSDSKTSSPGITPSTPQPINPSKSAEPLSAPTVKPVTVNNPKPVDDTSVAEGNKTSETDEPTAPEPKADEDWKQPRTASAEDIFIAFQDALVSYTDKFDEDDENPKYDRQRSLAHYAESDGGPGAIVEAKNHLRAAAEILAGFLNGAR